MLGDAQDPMVCACCRRPTILTVGVGVCARCFHLLELAASRLLESTELEADEGELPIDELALVLTLGAKEAA